MATKEPWLDGLSDDWIAQSCLSTLSQPNRPSNLLPKPLSQNSIARRSSSRPNKHAHKQSMLFAQSHPKSLTGCEPSLSKSSIGIKPRDSLRSRPSSLGSALQSSNSESQTSNASIDICTMNVKSAKQKESDSIPEWKRRLLRGDAPGGESGDLFGPIGLQKLFTPPLGSESVIQAELPKRHLRNKSSLRSRLSGNAQKSEIRSLSTKDDSQKPKLLRSWDKENINLTWMERMSEVSPADLTRLLRESQIDMNESDIGRLKQDFSKLSLCSIGPSIGEARSRSASGLDETRNEAISPILLPTNTRLEEESRLNICRPTSSASDSYCDPFFEPTERYTDLEASIEMTSQSLPEGLSMGTQEFVSAGGFVNMRRGGYSDDHFFNGPWLSPSVTPSQFPPSVAASRSQKPPPSQSNSRSAPPKSSHPVTPKKQTGLLRENSQPSDTSAMKSGSPLKLFGDYDTFTNDKLLRRMSQFEESFEATIEEGPSCAVESDEASENEIDCTKSERYVEGQAKLPPRGSSRSRCENTPSQKQVTAFHSPKHADKRVLNSPTKDSAPKRRRTLVTMNEHSKGWHEPIIESAEFSSAQAGLQQPLNTVGTTKPSQGNQSAFSLPVRPDNPTPTQTRLSSTEASTRSQPTMNRNTGPLPRTIQHSPTMNAIRKGSITTQDFFDEATKIMNHLRTRGGLKNGLPGLGEPVAGNEEGFGDTLSEESTQEEFSRPPSREGGDLRKQRTVNQPDPRIISHLKRFEDSDELDVFMGTSVMSLRLKSRQKGARRLGAHVETEERENSPTNIRIHESIQNLHSGQRSAGQVPDLGISREELRTATSSRSIPSDSTGSARAKGIISSQMISHLIPEKVGAMTYDPAHQTWIKGGQNHDPHIASFISEDDPFRDIPDLSVDELRELVAVREMRRGSAILEVSEPSDNQSQRADQNQSNTYQTGSGTRPQSGKSAASFPLYLSSVQSKSSEFTSSEPQPETRATSWATGDLTTVSTHPPGEPKPDSSKHAQEAKHESRLHDGYLSRNPSAVTGDRKQARAVTITFSSPLVSRVAYGEEDFLAEGCEAKDLAAPAGDGLETRDCETSGIAKQLKSVLKVTSPQTSQTGRAVSRISQGDEGIFPELSVVNQELSVLPGQEQLSLIAPEGSPFERSYSFHLSPLAEFTVNQIDESVRLELSYVAERTHPHSLRQVHGSFALAAEELIKHITDVEPYEAYWGYLRRLNLRSKKLITLLRLNKYCCRLEELDASDNSIGQLSGVPTAMRSLNVSRNCLSNLTAWNHLLNLQYLDVSNNELENLDGLSGLIHLRSLKVNNNKLTCINGVYRLDGLLTLQAKNNLLDAVDFKRAELLRLKQLDLAGNEISNIANIDSLSALETLDLRHNKIQSFNPQGSLQHLQSLKLSHNHLQDLDLAVFPALQLLYVDCNHLSTIRNLEMCQCLDTVSIREQTNFLECGDPPYPLAVGFDMSANTAIRKVYLSCNKLSSDFLVPASPNPTLQFMDLASCGLEELPPGFGTSFPNLRSLNLNFNALSDVRSLDGICRLSRLSLVGNRISRLRQLCQVLRLVGGREGCLTKVDLRGNPLTVGFYPSPVFGNGKSIQRGSDRGHNRRKMHQLVKRSDSENNGDDALAPLGGCADIARAGSGEHASLIRPEEEEVEIEIDDPYTVPPASSAADEKYLVHLDEATRLRRRVVELMIHAATSSRLKMLDGLEVRSSGEGEQEAVGLKKDWVWKRLVELGVLKKRQ
ncbi:Protein nud1 [Emydomyces testavorans]|uniref:Protein nud1 n=1 Tax=Emydomyces testavorans TaxID=2070801 RepID=A0AAF0DET2_9EURO|nr:Protein nud1 [Emydomyces testavorans]